MFFSVKTSLKISGKVYTPCICYVLTENLTPTIKKLVNEGKAAIYKEKVAFQNGKVLPSVKERKALHKAVIKAEKESEKKNLNKVCNR